MILFTTPHCANCVAIKQRLDEAGISYTVENRELTPDEVSDAAFHDVGPFQAPIAKLGDGRWLDYDGIILMIRKGEYT